MNVWLPPKAAIGGCGGLRISSSDFPNNEALKLNG